MTPVPAIEAGRGRRGAALGRRFTVIAPLIEDVIVPPAVEADDIELLGLDGLAGVISPERNPDPESSITKKL